ncbi:uncharacterized protein A1O9_00375 [Exophiala aquamarina CBS 119918]|uniref:Major facilitator superfamily (MFS) profile domain-containing protein n=1 Tax=Exophiala aquamarina CBS 119918 TaxID=1182545 RepID=A0A072PSU2_9EURO|nr:uncharacterized protein A1O9_00375 [Exophiala aquamarina CBS 119918]KEF62403.1 hypothetical protein A1O9_00375 [Exophiala aquamarina CBS 119918]
MQKGRSGAEEQQIEFGVKSLPIASTWDAIINSFSENEARALKRKVGLQLVVILGLCYCVSLLDRNNLGNAAITGMINDLYLIGNQYNLIVLLFFITCVTVQPIAVAVCRKIGPRTFVLTTVLLWGTLLLGFGCVQHCYQLLPLRVVLGLTGRRINAPLRLSDALIVGGA